jgi:hypothetical protein
MRRKLCIAASVFAVLSAVGVLVWWSRNFWLVDALLLRSSVAAGVLAALAAGGWQWLHQNFSLRTQLIVVTLLVTTLIAVLFGLDVWLAY